MICVFPFNDETIGILKKSKFGVDFFKTILIH